MSLDCTKCLCTVSHCNKQNESNNGAGVWTDQAYCNHVNTTAPPDSGCKATCSNPQQNKADYCPCLLTGCPDAPFPEGSILYTNKKFCDAQNKSLPDGCSAKCIDNAQCLCNISGCNNNSLNSIMWTNKTYCDSLAANFSGCQASCDCTKKGF